MHGATHRARAYHAFISYSRAGDGKLAPALQRGLQRFAKPWYRLRALRVFRDDASLSANPNLWASIEQALDDSAFFILLASPESGQSKWVGEEARWWLEHRGTDRLLIVLTGGELVWEPGRGVDSERTNALPPTLRGAFAEEPRYVDVRWARSEEQFAQSDARFRSALADLAAPLHGRSKDEMLSEDVRQHRRAIGIAWTAGVTVAALGVAAGVLAILAVQARNAARTEARIALSGQLAAVAASELEAKPQVSALLALESFRLVRDESGGRSFDARDSMLTALERSPRTVAVLDARVSVNAVAFSPDGKTLAAGGSDGTVRLWDTVRHTKVGETRRRKDDAVAAVLFSPDGRLLAFSSDFEADVRLWDTVRRTGLGRPLRLENSLAGFAFSRDGRRLATADIDGAVTLWNTRRQERLGRPLRVGNVSSVALGPDAALLAVGGDDGTVRLWDIARRKEVGPPLGGGARIDVLAFSPDGKTIATADINATVRIWDLPQRKELGRPLRGGDLINGLAFSRDGTMLAGAGIGEVRLWDARNPKLIETLRGHVGYVNGAAFGSDGTLASAGTDATVRLWTTRRAQPLGRTLRARSGSVADLAFGPGSRTLAAVDDDGAVTLQDVGRSGRLAEGFPGRVNGMSLSPDGTMLAAGGDDGAVQVWDVRDRRRFTRLLLRLGPSPALAFPQPDSVAQAWRKGLDPVTSVAFSGDGETLVAGGIAGTVRRWGTGDWKELGRPLAGEFLLNDLAFSPDDTTLAAAAGDVMLWDARESNPRLRTLPVGLSSSVAVAFSPDGMILAAGGDDGIRLWRTTAWTSLGRPLNAGGEVSRLAFSPDGTTLVSVDGALRMWDPRRQQQLGEALRASNGVKLVSVAVGSDGKALATGGDDGSVILWDSILLSTDYEAWRDRLCRIAGRNLTRVEWGQFVPGQAYHRSCPRFP